MTTPMRQRMPEFCVDELTPLDSSNALDIAAPIPMPGHNNQGMLLASEASTIPPEINLNPPYPGPQASSGQLDYSNGFVFNQWPAPGSVNGPTFSQQSMVMPGAYPDTDGGNSNAGGVSPASVSPLLSPFSEQMGNSIWTGAGQHLTTAPQHQFSRRSPTGPFPNPAGRGLSPNLRPRGTALSRRRSPARKPNSLITYLVKHGEDIQQKLKKKDGSICTIRVRCDFNQNESMGDYKFFKENGLEYHPIPPQKGTGSVRTSNGMVETSAFGVCQTVIMIGSVEKLKTLQVQLGPLNDDRVQLFLGKAGMKKLGLIDVTEGIDEALSAGAIPVGMISPPPSQNRLDLGFAGDLASQSLPSEGGGDWVGSAPPSPLPPGSDQASNTFPSFFGFTGV